MKSLTIHTDRQRLMDFFPPLQMHEMNLQWSTAPMPNQ